MKTVWILISWLLQKPADLDLHCVQKKCYLVLYYMYFQRVNCLTTGRYASLSFRTSKIFFGQEHYGHLLVPGKVEHFTVSTSLPYSTNISCPENVVCLYSRALQATLNMLANIMNPISTQCAYLFFLQNSMPCFENGVDPDQLASHKANCSGSHCMAHTQ